MKEDEMIRHARVLFRDIAPYLSDLERGQDIIMDAMNSGDPEKYLNGLLEKGEQLNSTDIRIILNRFKKVKRC